MKPADSYRIPHPAVLDTTIRARIGTDKCAGYLNSLKIIARASNHAKGLSCRIPSLSNRRGRHTRIVVDWCPRQGGDQVLQHWHRAPTSIVTDQIMSRKLELSSEAPRGSAERNIQLTSSVPQSTMVHSYRVRAELIRGALPSKNALRDNPWACGIRSDITGLKQYFERPYGSL